MNFESFVLAASTATLADEPRARAHADAIEFRLDLADEPLAQLARYDGELPILATNRPTWEGGARSGDERSRLDTLAEATTVDAVAAIDVELAAIRAGTAGRLLDAARENDVAVVVSVHDFDGTSSLSTLLALLEAAGAHGAVAKLAVTAESPADTLTLLRATHEATAAGQPVATMAMGELGSHTRAVAPVYGSRIGYAPLDPAATTAPGQLDLATLATTIESVVAPHRSKREN
ncbi:3-dehydroquinate dehydratase [Halovivax asiaticus JCM 14624]|uniref:3-dehydroquinate dehydratase n=1 Tax=Halovivax asiaticus JCM 14624 TaxID=1227490 RepID=M0BBD6_9EURY|nr:type I 3-dehydroquinate dehydratase [Halovivax asiaticus]ELZ08231.1 3-dehydroquinate dehydratase [Halovivax asiaticus JCM 14624]